MGTSSNQRSPKSPPWHPVRNTLGLNLAPVDLQSREIWRAATGDREGRLAFDLGNMVLAKAAAIAGISTSPSDAAASFDALTLKSGQSGLVVEIARRALVRAVATKQGGIGFASEVFAETASYFVSRDLPSFVGALSRVESTSAGIELKRKIREIAKSTTLMVAKTLGTSEATLGKGDTWPTLVTQVVSELKQVKSK